MENPVILAVPIADFHSMGLYDKADMVVEYVKRLLRMKGYNPPPEADELMWRINGDAIEFQFREQHKEPNHQ